MLKRISGKVNVEWYPKTASTVMKNGNVVQFSSGQLIAATATSTLHAGVILRDCLSTDSDYATTASVPVDVPSSSDVFEADVKVGVTAAASSVGATCDLYIDSSTKEMYVDTGTNSHKQVTIVGFVNASKVLVKLNSLNVFQPAA
jgi:hypothetical protein